MQEQQADRSEITKVTPVSENSATRKHLNHFRYSVTFLALVASVASLALAGYVLFVGNQINNLRQTDMLSIAALNAASTLRRITVESPSFGAVGLCDLDAEDNRGSLNNPYFRSSDAKLLAGVEIMGINHLYATLRNSALIADRINHPLIKTWVAEDFIEVSNLKSSLVSKTYQARSSIYENIYKTLTKSIIERDTSLVSLHINFGGLIDSLGSSQIKAPSSTNPDYVDKDGRYKSGIAIPVPNFAPITFIGLAGKIMLVSPTQFIARPIAPGQFAGASAPSAVLIEAVYRTKQKGRESTLVKKTACAALGGKQSSTSSSALLVSFPQGMPELFHSINEIMFYKKWQGESAWRQAINGDVPGSGSLRALNDGKLSRLTPGDAMALLVYHWFRLLPTDIELQKCEEMLSFNLTDLKLKDGASVGSSTKVIDSIKARAHNLPDVESPPINSCLAKDSIGRTAALLDKAIPGGRGQWSISQLFSKIEVAPAINPQPVPPSALPLFVDASGNCNLVGCSGFQESLIKDFFSAVYETNLSSFESLSTAQLLLAKYNSEQRQIQQQMAIEREELSSIEHRLKLLGEETASATPLKISVALENERQSELLKGRFKLMKMAIMQAQQSLTRLNRLIELSLIAIENAGKAANATYELTAHLFTMCKEGLSRLASPQEHYLIGKKFLFTPVARAVCDSDFTDAAKVRHGEEDLLKNISPWLKKNLTVLKELELGLAQSDPTYNAMIRRVMSIDKVKTAKSCMQPETIVFYSDSLITGNSFCPHAYPNYPFFNSVIPNGQLFYYCQQAVKTGANPSVSWSALARDVVGFRSRGVSGMPLKANDKNWCNQKGDFAGLCPGLACEFQLRTPIPELDNISLGSYIRNSSKHLVPQLPPVPAEML
jgi:hypothetical protein